MSIALAVGFLPACNRSPTDPGASVVGVEVAGPQVLNLGDTYSFSAFAVLSNGSRRYVTEEARWSEGFPAFGDDSGLVSIAGPGVATGLKTGETRKRATFEGYSNAKQVMVLPAGTYRPSMI